ncbi:hypothetical protein [Nostoc sp. FACHB-133]|uniref:hypothetical protein n=1 Tax=Nostoc sp. FACHB-133 TaxID=2692835 RepID=UPI0016863EBF|nr:hypothetical protein [Nostoc sp. FACHB-133]MBD2522122.1 hypothetical protein [Nostoc sp. FACHB-133]
MFSQPFKPALNKDGYARLTFIGYEVKVGYRDNGTEWSMFLLNFVVKGAIRGTDKIIPITKGF